MRLFADKARSQVRPARRVSLNIRFKLAGKDESGFAFEDFAETVNLSASGGCLVVKKDLRTGETLRLFGPRGTAFVVTVRWFKYDMRTNLRLLGFEVVKPTSEWVLIGGSRAARG